MCFQWWATVILVQLMAPLGESRATWHHLASSCTFCTACCLSARSCIKYIQHRKMSSNMIKYFSSKFQTLIEKNKKSSANRTNRFKLVPQKSTSLTLSQRALKISHRCQRYDFYSFDTVPVYWIVQRCVVENVTLPMLQRITSVTFPNLLPVHTFTCIFFSNFSIQ